MRSHINLKHDKKIPKEFDDKFINLYDFFPSKTQQIETKYNKKSSESPQT